MSRSQVGDESWSDEICTQLADYGESQSGRFVYFDSFASDFLDRNQRPNNSESNQKVVLAIDSVFRMFGNRLDSPRIILTDDHIEMLRDTYGRWQVVFLSNVNDTEIAILEVLNRLSIVENDGSFSIESVATSEIAADGEISKRAVPISDDQIEQTLTRLEVRKLARTSLYIGDSSCKATYAGAVRSSRVQVVSDAEIDQLRVQGESETLDYKRQIKTASKTDKAEFVRDIEVK